MATKQKNTHTHTHNSQICFCFCFFNESSFPQNNKKSEKNQFSMLQTHYVLFVLTISNSNIILIQFILFIWLNVIQSVSQCQKIPQKSGLTCQKRIAVLCRTRHKHRHRQKQTNEIYRMNTSQWWLSLSKKKKTNKS